VCHTPTFRTSVNVAFPAMSNQLIHPYTDLLVHDMGSGLADNRSDYRADGNEWRTAPLWGIGLYETVNYPAYYLHDGRARTLVEAVMWHDGEARSSVDFVKQLSTSDRKALFAFLKSL
ncbi:MAG: thiol oxidoreductase, partial [Bacteroidia bacterium]|nr:thiol oxidoreductase [Bacteroidia bacterium]